MPPCEEAGDVGDEQAEDPCLGVHADEDVPDECPGDTRAVYGPTRYGRIISWSSCSTMWQCQTKRPARS
jgi:hypothetical protein